MKPDNKLINAYCDDVLGTKDGVELAAMIATGGIQRSEAIEAAIARAQRVNATLMPLLLKPLSRPAINIMC